MPFNWSRGAHKAIKVLFRNTDLHGFKYIVEDSRSYFEKVSWFFIQIIVLLVTVYLILNYWNTFMENPTLTARMNTNVYVEDIQFPAISICNLNKLSKGKVEKIKEFFTEEGLSPNKTKRFLNYLGLFMDYDRGNSDDLFEIQKLLEQYQKQVLKQPRFSTEDLVYTLITPCHKLLKSCKWGARVVPCENIFDLRLTFEGHCCTFNYLKNRSPAEMKFKSEFNRESPSVNSQLFGVDFGLTVVIDNRPDDYFFTSLAGIGVNIHIFHPEDYPDKNSGSLTEVTVPMGQEAFIEINPTVIMSDQGIKQFPFDKRLCVYASEKSTSLGEYTQSDCYVACRVKSFLALCECVPYMIPMYNNTDVCTLTDIPCLSRFADKWRTAFPYDTVREDLSREIQNGLMCDDICYSACELTLYGVSTYALDLNYPSNETIVHIFYPSKYNSLFKIDVMYHWYEVLSSFGGLFGITMGLSLVSVLEVVIYLTYKLLIYGWVNE